MGIILYTILLSNSLPWKATLMCANVTMYSKNTIIKMTTHDSSRFLYYAQTSLILLVCFSFMKSVNISICEIIITVYKMLS